MRQELILLLAESLESFKFCSINGWLVVEVMAVVVQKLGGPNGVQIREFLLSIIVEGLSNYCR